MEFERSGAGELVKIHLIALFSVIFQASAFKQYSCVQVTMQRGIKHYMNVVELLYRLEFDFI